MQNYPKRRPMAEINVVPYIDVMLVLLVIFMITAPLLNQGIDVQLPQAEMQAISAKDQEPIVVSVDANGVYYLNTATHPEQPIDASALQNSVLAAMQLAKQKNIQRAVLVKGDSSVPYGKVMQAMSLLQQAGVPSVGLMTQPMDMKQQG